MGLRISPPPREFLLPPGFLDNLENPPSLGWFTPIPIRTIFVPPDCSLQPGGSREVLVGAFESDFHFPSES